MNMLKFVRDAVAEKAGIVLDANRKVWEYAELSHSEYQSAALLTGILRSEGFTVTEGLVGVPTAFEAVFGEGHPVMGFLGEYDALPVLSQQAGCPTQNPVQAGAPGHGCAHSALGAGSLAAALAVKQYLESTGESGTVIYFGCAAEENIGVKPLLAEAGEFADVDGVFAWHPAAYNGVNPKPCISVSNIEYEFHGTTSHAGGAPHLGRSALDACELMNVGVNYLREHVVSDARLHYAYLDCGGTAPNIVQDHAKLLYCVRAPKWSQVKEILERVTNCARGAALMTGTTMTCKLRMGYSDCFQNSVMAEILEEALREVGVPQWDEADYALAREYVAAYNPVQRDNMIQQIRSKYPAEQFETKLNQPLDTAILHYDKTVTGVDTFSTDVGDVGYVTPTASLSIATQTIGCPGHSWYVTGMANSSIGEKGIIAAGETMALAALKAMHRPEALKAAREELIAATGGGYDCPMKGMRGPFTI